MKNSLIIFFLFVLNVFAYSQNTDKIQFQNPNFKITGTTSVSYGATSINNEFINKLVFGGYINNELKNKISSKTKASNRIGGELNYEFKFYNLKDTFLTAIPNYKYYFGFGSFQNISSKFSNDFYQVVFHGNKEFVGKTAKLGNTTLFQSAFKKISFGLVNSKTKTSFAISIISGDKHNYYNFKTADLKTSSDAQEITLDYSAEIQKSDSINNGFLAFSGAGIALDFSTQIKNILNISITNLGFAIWNRNPSQIEVNQSYSFNGFYVDNLFNGDQINLNSSIDSIIPPLENKSFIEPLPTIFKIESIIKSNQKVQLIYGMRYKIFSNYFPLIHLGIFYNINNKLKCSTAITYGGYNNFEGNLNLFYHTNSLNIGIGTNNLIGNISKNGFGKSVHLSVMSNF